MKERRERKTATEPAVLTPDLLREATLSADRIGPVRRYGHPAGRLPARAENLVVARESVTGVTGLMEGMIMQTLNKYPNLPGSQKLVAAGLDPVTRPEDFRAEVLRAGRTRAVLFQIDGTWCLYSAGSAANKDAAGDNGFNVVLREVITRLRPVNVYLSTFSRLVRSPHFAGLLMSTLEENVQTLHAGETPIQMATPFGRAMFQLLTLFSSMERDAQLQRMLLGHLAKYRNGKWLLGATSVPMGFRIGGAGGLEPDPEGRDAVATLIRALGDKTPTAQKIDQVAAHIASGPRQSADRTWHYRHGTDGTADRATVTALSGQAAPDPDRDEDPDRTEGDAEPKAVNPYLRRGDAHGPWNPRRLDNMIIDRWYRLLDVYEHGRYTVLHNNPLSGVTQYAEYKVVEGKGRYGHIPLHMAAPPPDGGWATPEEFARARHRQEEWARERVPGPHVRRAYGGTRLPFLGHGGGWPEGDSEYRLLGRPGRYELWVRPLETSDTAPAPRQRGGVRVSAGTRLAVLNAADLHRDVCDTVAAAIRDGVDGRLVGLPSDFLQSYAQLGGQSAEPSRGERLAAVADRTAEIDRSIARLGRALDGEDDQEEAADIKKRRKDLRAQKRALEVGAAELTAAATQAGTRTVVHGHVQLLLAVLAAVRDAEGPLPAAVATDLAQVLPDMRFTSGALQVTWRCDVLIPLEDGSALRLGPVTGTVSNIASVAGRKGEGIADSRSEAVAHALLTTDQGQIAVKGGWQRTGRTEVDRATAWLEGRHPGIHARAILRCPILETRRAVWDGLSSLPARDEFSAHVARCYLVPGSDRGDSKWRSPTFLRDRVAAWFLDRGGSAPAPVAAEYALSIGVSATTFSSYRGVTAYSRMTLAPLLQWASSDCPRDCPRFGHQPRCTKHGTLRLLPCPHDCNGYLSIQTPVPECPDSVLCETCLRMPSGGPAFPIAYKTVRQADADARDRTIRPHFLAQRRRKHGLRLGQVIREWAQGSFDVKPKGKLTNAVNAAWAALTEEQKLEVPAYAQLRARGDRQTITEAQVIRRWATSEGIPISKRGQVPLHVLTLWYSLGEGRRNGVYGYRELWGESAR